MTVAIEMPGTRLLEHAAVLCEAIALRSDELWFHDKPIRANREVYPVRPASFRVGKQHADAVRPRRKARLRPLLLSLLVAAPCGSVAAWQPWARAASLFELRDRTIAAAVLYQDGSEAGFLPPEHALTTMRKDGQSVVRITLPLEDVPEDFTRVVDRLEGEGTLGVAPLKLAQSVFCYGMAWTGLRQAGAVGLNNGRCAGASTLLGQAARTLRDDQTYSASRKLGELFDASALALRLRHRRERDTFIANTLRFGHSGGAPLIGLRAASLTVFNREPKQLRLHEHALIAAMLLYPAQLHCGPATQNDIRRFNQQRNRARYGLVRAFEGDPRLAGELDALAKLAPITAPPPLPGLPERMACQANIHPLLRLGAVDPAAQRAMLRERESLNRLGIKASAYRLSFDRPEQAEFSRAIEQSRSQMAAQGGWIADPRSDEVVVLGFAARPDGKLSALYDSAANPQLFARRELGSLGKLAALAFLAERGWRPDQPLCNLAWGGRHNAGGNAGARTCDTPGARMTVSHAFGHSISLAVREALSHFPDAALRMRMTEWGFTVPSSSPASYNVAFGLAQASPAHLSAFTAALSRGLAGEPAIAAEPRVLVQYRDSFGKWRPVPQKGVVDLRGVFMTERGRAVVAEGAAAALLPGGTLHALGIKPPLSVAKSGTLDDEAKRVRFKAAAGAWRGSAWFAMVAPRTGPLGGPSIAMIPLATSVRHAMVQQPQRR